MRRAFLAVWAAATVWPVAPVDATVVSTPLADVVVSADGRSAYWQSRASESLSRSLPGAKRLALTGCLRSDSTQGCADLLAVPLGDAAAPNHGRLISSLAMRFAGAVTEGLGALHSCLAHAATKLCRDARAWSTAVSMSPNGESMYVVSRAGDAVTHFRVDDGSLIAFEGCLADDAARGCGDLPGAPLAGARGVTVSPDGEAVYVVSPERDSIAHFRRTSNGSLSFAGCLAGSGAGGCEDLPLAPLDGADRVAVSSDGRSLYVAAQAKESVFHFFRSSNGMLRYGGCLGTTSGVLGVPGTLNGRCGRSDLGGFPTVPRCQGKLATVIGRADRNGLSGTPGADTIVPLDVNRVWAGRGADRVCAGSGRDVVRGGPGPDHLEGEGGDDVLRGGPGSDLLEGGDGRDTCWGGGGRDRSRRCEAGP
jgi:RTX calcium-binding nonapeptide repeat (4 copies)